MKTVKDVAKELDISEHTVRYYTDLGLVPSLKRDANGNRIFDEKSLNWLTGVKYLRNSGMSLKAVKQYVDLCVIGENTLLERREIIRQQKIIVEKQLIETQQRYSYISGKLEWYNNIIDGKIYDNSNPDTWDKDEFDSKINHSSVISKK